MRELSIGDIVKLQENKRATIYPNNVYRYLNGNSILYEKVILSDPISSTFIQLQNSDGTLDIISESVKARNFSVNGLSSLNKTRINNELLVKGQSLFQGDINSSNNISCISLYSDELTINNFSTFNSIFVSNDITNQGFLTTTGIYTNYINSSTNELIIGDRDNVSEITIGNINSTINILGNLKYNSVENDIVCNREFVLNGVSGVPIEIPVNDVGIYFSNGLDNKKGYIKTNSSNGETLVIKPPNSFYELHTPNLNSDSTIVCYDNESKNVFFENLITLGDASLNNLSVVSNATFTNISINDLYNYGNIHLEGSINSSGNINFNNKLYSLDNDPHIFINKLAATNINIDSSIIHQASIDEFFNKKSTIIDATIEKANVNICSISKGTIEYCEVNQIKNDELTARKAKIETLIVDSDMTINNLIIKKNTKVYGNETVYGNLEAQNLQLANLANIKNIESKEALITSIKSSLISTQHLCSNTLELPNKFYVGDNLIVSNDTDVLIHSSLKVDNETQLANLKINNEAIVKNLSVSNILEANQIRINNKLDAEDDINAKKNITIFKDLNVLNKCNFNNDVNCNSNVIINGNLNIKKELVVEHAKINKTLDTYNINVKNISISSNCIIGGNCNVANINSNGNIISNEDVLVNGNLYVSGYAELSRCIIKNGLSIVGDVLINDEPIVNRNYLSSIGTTYSYFSLDGTTFSYDFSIKDGLYTYIINGHTLNKTKTSSEPIKNNIYSVAINIDNSIIIGGSLNTNRVLCKFNPNTNTWNNIQLDGNSIDLIKCDQRGVVYYAGDFGDNGKLYQYFPDTGIWNYIGKNILGQIKTIVFDSNYNVYIGGNITINQDNIQKRIVNIAKYNVHTNTWESLNQGLDNIVNSMTIDLLDNIYVGGEFTNYLIRWNIKKNLWEPLGISLDRSVNCLAIDSNNLLYIGGRFYGNIARYNIDTFELQYIKNGLIGDIKLIVIDSNDNIYLSLTSAPYLFKWSELDKKWIGCIRGINGPITSLIFDKNDKLYIAGNFTVPHNKFIIYDSENTKTIRFNNLIKYVDLRNNLIVGKKIVFNKIGQTLTVKFEKNVGYILNKSEFIQLTV